MLTLQFALYGIAFAVATRLQRRLTRERIEGMSVGPNLELRDRIADRLWRQLCERESRRGRR